MSYLSESESDNAVGVIGDGDIEAKTRQSQIWTTVRVTIHCHSRGFSQLVTLIDPVSRWIHAENIPAGCDNIPHFIATFMFKTFCNFGFPAVELFNFNSIQFELIAQEYNDMLTKASEVLPALEDVKGKISLKTSDETFLGQDIFNHLIDPNDIATNIWLLSLRTQQNELGVSPFQMMFSRKIINSSSFGLDVKQTRRKLQSSVLHCRHCDETFTSKISFRIHQRRHTEEARLRGQREGEATLKKVSINDEDEEKLQEETIEKSYYRKNRSKLQRKKRLAKLAEKWSNDEVYLAESVKQDLSENAAEAVKDLLVATREERQKRGKYFRYGPELRDEIAEYALHHGNSVAASFYSDKLNMVVAESSVRNFVRDLQSFPQQLRLEIGNYAEDHGLDRTVLHYSTKLGQEVTKGMVRRFRKLYSGSFVPKCSETVGGKSSALYSQELREEIGRYASVHGVEAAVQVYSDKLLFAVKPSTVRKFRQLYGESGPENLSYMQLSETSSTTIDLLHSSLDVLNQHGSPYLTNYISGTSAQNVILSNTGYQQHLQLTGEKQEPIDVDPSSILEAKSVIVESSPKKVVKKKVKKETRKIVRGRYVQYSDEMRAEIGKFALKHGNSAAMKHFFGVLGHEIPESTIRGMRDKYQLMVERKGEGVARVGCGPRGRPTSLGNHDILVQEAVKKLRDKGEKITSFVVIAVAKQVIMQQDPSLLHDCGGPIKLNTAWAKSMIRRLGIKNK